MRSCWHYLDIIALKLQVITSSLVLTEDTENGLWTFLYALLESMGGLFEWGCSMQKVCHGRDNKQTISMKKTISRPVLWPQTS